MRRPWGWTPRRPPPRSHRAEAWQTTNEGAGEVVEAIREAGGEAVADTTDVPVDAGGEEIVNTAFDAFGRIDIVVANAGILLPRKPFADTFYEDFERTWRVHAGDTYSLLRAAWPHLVAQGYGRVITTTSCAGVYGEEGSPEYSSAKGAIAGLTRARNRGGRWSNRSHPHR